MHKPNSLRAHLSEAIADLKQNPDKLLLFVDSGNVCASATPSLSFEYRYTLNIVLVDYTGEEDAIMVALLAWLRVHQIELLTNPDLRKTAIQFEVDLNNHASSDISISLALTERVIVKGGDGGRLDLRHRPEPQQETGSSIDHWQLYAGENKLAEWPTPQAAL